MVAALLGIASKLGWMAITALAAIVGAKYGPQAAQAVHDAWHGKGESITEEQARQILAAYKENEAEIAANMAENLSFGVARPDTGDPDDVYVDLLGWPEKEPEGATNAVDSREFYDPDYYECPKYLPKWMQRNFTTAQQLMKSSGPNDPDGCSKLQRALMLVGAILREFNMHISESGLGMQMMWDRGLAMEVFAEEEKIAGLYDEAERRHRYYCGPGGPPAAPA